MLGFFLFVFHFALHDPDNYALFAPKTAKDRCDIFWCHNQAIDRNGLFCYDCLLITSDSILAKISDSSDILCCMWRVLVAIHDRNIVSFSFRILRGVRYQFDTFICDQKILSDCSRRVRSLAKTCTREIIGSKENRLDITRFCISRRGKYQVRQILQVLGC